MSDWKLLGIALRARWLGFAVLDAHRRLLDWGMMFYQRKTATEIKSAKNRLEALLVRTNPSRVVLVLPGAKANEKVVAARSLTRALRALASSRSIEIVAVSRAMISEVFKPCNAKAKREIASLLARMFPEIAWKLPPERKIWAKEDSRMALFDALAGVVAHHKQRFGNAVCEKGS